MAQRWFGQTQMDPEERNPALTSMKTYQNSPKQPQPQAMDATTQVTGGDGHQAPAYGGPGNTLKPAIQNAVKNSAQGSWNAQMANPGNLIGNMLGLWNVGQGIAGSQAVKDAAVNSAQGSWNAQMANPNNPVANLIGLWNGGQEIANWWNGTGRWAPRDPKNEKDLGPYGGSTTDFAQNGNLGTGQDGKPWGNISPTYHKPDLLYLPDASKGGAGTPGSGAGGGADGIEVGIPGMPSRPAPTPPQSRGNVGVREMLEGQGIPASAIGWDDANKRVTVNGKPLNLDVTIQDGRSFADEGAVRQALHDSGFVANAEQAPLSERNQRNLQGYESTIDPESLKNSPEYKKFEQQLMANRQQEMMRIGAASNAQGSANSSSASSMIGKYLNSEEEARVNAMPTIAQAIRDHYKGADDMYQGQLKTNADLESVNAALSGIYRGNPTEARRQFNEGMNLSWAQLESQHGLAAAQLEFAMKQANLSRHDEQMAKGFLNTVLSQAAKAKLDGKTPEQIWDAIASQADRFPSNVGIETALGLAQGYFGGPTGGGSASAKRTGVINIGQSVALMFRGRLGINPNPAQLSSALQEASSMIDQKVASGEIPADAATISAIKEEMKKNLYGPTPPKSTTDITAQMTGKP